MDTTTRYKFNTSQFKIKIALHNSRKEQQEKTDKSEKNRKEAWGK